MRLFFILLLCFSGLISLSAQESAVKQYQENSIYLQSRFGGYKYIKEGKVYRKGFMAFKLKRELQVSPNAIIEFKKYQRNKWLAAGIGIGGYVLLASSFDVSNGGSVNINTYFISLGTFATCALVAKHSRNKLHKSVWLYNQDILR